ncbi:E3 ubiquitin-protein ligase Praja-2 isoform X2 [Colius striatus]|nr:E3 ubiquitin-protein ligase Praja-2 isoform X2 [Colius striatus]XP_061875260.1 E3 ubiquitin-protein ligase Praja-2 isoform X2 [Colius striatus]
MGQEAGKPPWPKPAGGFQTVRSKRYGRRHAYVSFRPPLNSQDRDEHQHNEVCKQLELENVQKENSLCSSPLVQAASGLFSESLENTGVGEPICRSVTSQAFDMNTSPLSQFSCELEDSRISGNFMNPHGNSEDLAEYSSGGQSDLNGQNGMAFVDIDSYEPDSSDGEEDDAQDEFSLAREEAGMFQETLDNVLSELDKGIESFTDVQSRLSGLNYSVSRECCEEVGPMPSKSCFGIDSELACPNSRRFKSSAAYQTVPKSSPAGINYESESVGMGTPVAIASELDDDWKTDEGIPPELVVRPKIRKQNTSNQFNEEKFLPNDNEESSSWRRTGIAEVQQGCAEYAMRNSKEEMSSSIFFDSREYEVHRQNTEIHLSKTAAAQEEDIPDDCTFWGDFEDCKRLFAVCRQNENSSECSDGEWSTAVPTYFTATEKDQSSSDESWETVSGREEHEPEVQSRSIDDEEESTDFCLQGGEQTLEEGEVPWLQYREEGASSSDEENDLTSDFVHPGFFLLDGNNNPEDDSSVSEDLDVEWRLLDEFDDLELAQAIPYVNPQFLSFMALERSLQEAVETALVQMESLGFDFEEAHPPATKETIDSLPQIIVTDNHHGQELCCAICCSEYVKDEVITELPCHHLFHKPCVTLWLQKSGTCPICRHVLGPVLPEATDTISILSDCDSVSSIQTSAGGSD